MQRIVIVGAGFAGLWAAVGAARKLDELGIGPEEVRVTVVNRDAYHAIRVRNYEPDLSDVRVPLDAVLGPVGVQRVEGTVTGIDAAGGAIAVRTAGGEQTLPYDRLVLAAGSALHRPALPGLADHAFDVDTFAAGDRLNRHVASLGGRPPARGRGTVVVVGAGLTGLEVACEMPAKLTRAGIADGRVILADRSPHIGSDMGDAARRVIEEALDALGIETRPGVSITGVDGDGVTLGGGERIAAHTVVWTAGMRASPLAELVPVAGDGAGRLPVDAFLKVQGTDGIFAAGDIARAVLDGVHASVMSCQHGRPMGRYAGHNVVCDLLGLPQLGLHIGHYVTCLDLGPWGALYTEGWERRVVATGEEAKRTKRTINRDRIYPPRSGGRAALLAAAAPEIQAPPRGAPR